MGLYKLSPLVFLLLIQNYFTLSSASSGFPLPGRFQISSESVFTEFEELLSKYKPIDLGAGAPDYPPPKNLQIALANAATSTDYSLSQYSPNTGLPRLSKAVSQLYSKFFNRTLNPDKDVIITAGALEALFVTISSHTLDGDESIVFEPYFELYSAIIKASNGVTRFTTLKPKSVGNNVTSADWTFDKEHLSNLFNEKTKGILLNTPTNPLGKVFSLEELTFIADLAKKWNAVVVADEVYRFVTFDNNKHISIASLPGMFERTVTIGSAGKLFGATGYSVGWAYGDSKLIDNIKSVHSLAVSCAPTPIQEAVAVALEQEARDLGKPYSVLERLRQDKETNRNYLYRILKDSGMTPVLPQAGFFMVANWTTMKDGVTLDNEKQECDDFKFAKWLIKNVNVFALPLSSFYTDVKECSGKDILRFALIKKNETYQNAEKAFLKWQLAG